MRFADDFLLFAPTEGKAEAARDFARAQLERLDLELHPEKTRIVSSGPEVIFLGHKLPKAPAVTRPKLPVRRRK